MQIALFDGAPAAAKPVRPPPAAQPPARIDGKAQYEDRQRDLDQLADRWEDLHVWVLRRHLRLIASPHTGDAERADILAWLDAPPVFDRPVAAFSVQACLAVYDGRIDVAEFQQLVRRIHRQVLDRRRARAA
jgi:hypothetical protein